jgi:predicted metal-dependent enzyme (double-stranded beta helix superfamily)
MKLRTLTLTPGSSESFDLAAQTKVTFLLAAEDDVIWLTAAPGVLDPDQAVRIDRGQCPVELTLSGTVYVHSPAQGERTVGVSIVEA